MEEQVVKLKRQVKKLKETINEMKYQQDKRNIIEVLSLNYYVVDRNNEYAFRVFEENIKDGKYLKALDAIYGLEYADKLMLLGVTFETIVKVLDEVYLQSVKMREPVEVAEEDAPFAY